MGMILAMAAEREGPGVFGKMNGGFRSIDQLTRPSTVLIQASLNVRSLYNRSFPKDK
jgi:hypothetical protein